MDVATIISNSFKFPLRNIKKLPLLFILFILLAIIPIGKLMNNDYVIYFGAFAFVMFILIVPGYLLSIVKTGSKESSIFPSFNLMNNIYDSIRVLALRFVYMIVPAAVFFILLSTLGPASVENLYEFRIHYFLAGIGLMIVIFLAIYLIFEFLLFFAKARLAYFNSLSEALKVNKVIGDIRNIGVINILKWLIVMVVLFIVISVASSVVLTIPYVGFLIYICIIIPTIESIGNYSLGLLYSNIERNSIDFNRIGQETKLLRR